VSRDAINHNSNVVVCVPGSDRSNFKRIYPSQMTVKNGSAGLSLDTVFMCEQIRAITVDRLRDRLGALDDEQLDTLDERLRIALNLD
jgi:mRNA interferase MazF